MGTFNFPYLPVDRQINFSAIYEFFPILESLKGVEQNPVFHGEGDVDTHTRLVCTELVQQVEWQNLNEEEKRIVFLTVLFHDIGKPQTTKLEDGKWISPKHAVLGEKIFREYFYQIMPMPFAMREEIAALIRFHGLPLFWMDKADTDFALIRASQRIKLSQLYLVAKADLLGRISADRERLLLNLELFKASAIELGCYDQPYGFKNEYTKFLYFSGKNIWRDDEIFDCTSFDVHLVAGLPYAGKDTFIGQRFADLATISLDDIRKQLKISPEKSSAKVVALAKENAKQFLRKKQPFVWNATNLKSEIRSSLIHLFAAYGARVMIHYLEVPYQIVMERMKQRKRHVPTKVIDHMIRKMDMVTTSEAYAVEYVVEDAE